MVVTEKILQQYIVAQCLLWLLFTYSQAAVLPADRADILYHSYDGGGVTISGPSVLVQKKVGESFSLSANYYVDMVSSASIDVITRASKYQEERTETSFSATYLNEKTTISLAVTDSIENDFKANSLHFGISQDMFGDLTTLSMGFSLGDDTVGKRAAPTFKEDVERYNFRTTLTQVMTKDLIMALSLEVITDEGYLNNPYREVRYVDGGAALGYEFQTEVYPRTRTSSAVGLKARYFLPYRAALHGEYRLFSDSWDITANIFEVGYTHPYLDNWIFDIKYRSYDQSSASFYSDLFPYISAQKFLARDKELSSFASNTIGIGVSYEFAKSETATINKASLNFKLDHIEFNYRNFRDLRQTSFAVGSEPLYKMSANVIQLFVSIWF